MSNIILETERLRIREMEVTDKGNLLTIFQDPVTMKYYPSTKNEEETIRWITWTLNNYRKFSMGMWIIEEKMSGRFLGQSGFVPQKIDGVVQVELGYLISRVEWGKGYASEAARACITYGHETLDIDCLISLIDSDNIPSIRVAEKVGMKFEKTVIKRGKELLLYKSR